MTADARVHDTELQNRPSKLVSACVAALLLLHVGMLGRLAFLHSPTYDETGHLPAGISHWTLGRFDLYRVNPPLVRMLAALPVLAAKPKTDWSRLSEQPGARPEFKIGRDFITANSAVSFRYFTISRWVGILFSVVGGYVCFRWALEIWGLEAGFVTLFLWCFDPNILGNAQTIQPDVPAATMAVVIAYSYWRWFHNPTVHRAVVTGLVLGIGLLTKTTILFMVPTLFLLWLVSLCVENWAPRISKRRALLHLSFIFAIGLYLLNLGYAFDGSFRRLGDFRFVSSTLRQSSPDEVRRTTPRPTGNRFAGTWLGNVPVPVPKDYLLGIDAQKLDFEGRLRSYLRGKTQRQGWWYFYLFAMLVKIPLGTWLLLGIATAEVIRAGPGTAGWRPILFVGLPITIFLTIVSSVTGMTHHMRYVLPAFPFLFILAGSAARAFHQARDKVTRGLAGAALLWMVASSLLVFPHSHSYFNELVGGPKNGHFNLLSSNVDYGEDLFFLKEWLDQHRHGRPLKLAYFGNFDPRVAGIDFSLPPKHPEPGLYAVSVNYLHGTSVPLHDGAGNLSFGDDYSYLLRFKPIGRAGYGILIYDLRSSDLVSNQPAD